MSMPPTRNTTAPRPGPGCTETASIDLHQWPPDITVQPPLVHFRCPAGHEFARTVVEHFSRPKQA